MKIAILVGVFPPKWFGGIEIATYNLASHLARKGHEVHVITSHDDGLPDLSEENGFYVHRVARLKIHIVGILPFWIRIYLLIRKIKPDVVHSQTTLYSIPAEAAKKFLKIPYVVWGRGSEIYSPGRLLSIISKSPLQNADAVLALTEDMKREMQKVCPREVSVIPNGISLEKFKVSSRYKKESTRTVIFVGRLHPVKGIQYLIEAMTIVHQKMPDTKLIIVGDGAERSRLEKHVKELDLNDCIQFAGKVPQERIPEFMHQADIFVLPSLSEGFPSVLLEAMASGLPVIATSVGGIPELIDEGINGFLVNIKRPDEIADRILTLMQNDDIRKEMSANNREKAELFTWDMVADKVEMIYRSNCVEIEVVPKESGA
jgi:glycosyltransferase involved in cell wall biosynthesis